MPNTTLPDPAFPSSAAQNSAAVPRQPHRAETTAPGSQPLVEVLTPDIAAPRRTEAALTEAIAAERQARRKAEAANRIKDEYLALLGHEVRNPLNAIATAVEVLNRAEAHTPVAVSARKIIGNQTRQLAGMMDRLLDVSQLLAGDVVLTRQPLNLTAAVERGASALRAQAEAKAHTLRVTRLDTDRADDTWISGDADRIRQLIEQLLSNAIKYMPGGGRINVEMSTGPGCALLRVEDTSGGIEPALLERIFKPFVEGEQGLSRKDGGLGIDLLLVRRLVELHGGSVQARTSDMGCVFEVRLPTIEPPQ